MAESFFPVVITVGSSPPSLVRKVVVTWGYTLRGNVYPGGSKEFSHEGGVVSGQVQKYEDPVTVEIDISVQFAPETELGGIVHHPDPFTPTSPGVNYSYRPRQDVI